MYCKSSSCTARRLILRSSDAHRREPLKLPDRRDCRLAVNPVVSGTQPCAALVRVRTCHSHGGNYNKLALHLCVPMDVVQLIRATMLVTGSFRAWTDAGRAGHEESGSQGDPWVLVVPKLPREWELKDAATWLASSTDSVPEAAPKARPGQEAV